jgi:hypothetical protein
MGVVCQRIAELFFMFIYFNELRASVKALDKVEPEASLRETGWLGRS